MKLPYSRIILFLATLVLSNAVAAQAYPNKTVKVVIPYPPGSGWDRVVRVISERLQRKHEQPFIVENRSGAGGNIGADYAYRAAPDGYTLLATAPSPMVINKTLYSKLPYDPDQFVPVSVMVSLPNVLVVTNRLPVESVKELLAHANANPGKLNYASQGLGTTPHLTGEMFKSMSGVKMVHVIYKGVTPALTDLIGGQVDMMFADIASALPHIKAGKLRAIAVASPKRSPLLPNTPTMAETIPGFSSVLWYGMAAPPKTPIEIANKLAASIAEEMKEPSVVSMINGLGMDVVGNTPAEMQAFLTQETQRWGKVIRDANIRID
jgi:tripartite-type tricarboxylate transporter receptor subunit TctC